MAARQTSFGSCDASNHPRHNQPHHASDDNTTSSSFTDKVRHLSIGEKTRPQLPPAYDFDPSSFSSMNHPFPSNHSISPSPRKKGPSKSFSGLRSGQVFRGGSNSGKFWRNLKATFHYSSKKEPSETRTRRSNTRSSNQNSFKRRSSSIAFLQRPWTSGSPFTSPSTQDSIPQQPQLPPKFENTRTFEPRLFIDPSHGAAARQAARDYGKIPQNAQTPPIPDDDWNTPRARESGISMGPPIDLDIPPDSSDSDTSRQPLDPVEYLPTELSSLVFSFLPAAALQSAEAVSHKWRHVAADPHLWRTAFLRQYGASAALPSVPTPIGGHGVGKTGRTEQPWKRMFAARLELDKNWSEGRATAVRLNGHTDSVYCVQFDEQVVLSREKVITGSRDRTIRVWDVKTGDLKKVIGVSTAFEMDRREQAARALPVESQQLRILNPRPIEPSPEIYLSPPIYHNASILCLQYDAEILVTGSSDCSLIVWDLKTWRPLHRLERHTMGVLDIVFDGEKIISCSKDSTICVWDRHTGELLIQLHGHRGPVNAVQLRGTLIVSASGEGCAKLWDLTVHNAGSVLATATARCIKDFWSQDRGLACVEFSDDARHVLAGGNDQVIYKFDADSGELCDTLRGHTSLVRSLYLDAGNNRIVSGSYDFSLRVWDYAEGRPAWTLQKWATSWTLSAKSDYRRIVCTNQDGRAMVVDFGVGVRDVELLDS